MYLGLVLQLTLVAAMVSGRPFGNSAHNAAFKSAPLAVDKVDQSIHPEFVPSALKLRSLSSLSSYHGSVRKQASFAKRSTHDVHGRNVISNVSDVRNPRPGIFQGKPFIPPASKNTEVESGESGEEHAKRAPQSPRSDIGEAIAAAKPPSRESEPINASDRDSSPVQKSGPHSPDTLDGLPQAEVQDGAHLVSGMTRHEKRKTNGHMGRNVQDHRRVKRGARMPDYKTTDIEEGPSSTSIAGPANTETPSAAS